MASPSLVAVRGARTPVAGRTTTRRPVVAVTRTTTLDSEFPLTVDAIEPIPQWKLSTRARGGQSNGIGSRSGRGVVIAGVAPAGKGKHGAL